MANAVKWTTYGTYTAAFDAGALKNQANAAYVLGNEIDNATGKNRWMDLVADADYATNPSSGGYIAVYLIPCIDGTNYADGSGSVVPQASLLIATFALRATTDGQRLAATRILIPPCKFKLLWENQGGQTTTNTDSLTMISYRMYNEELQ